MGAGSVGPAAGALRDVMRSSAIRRIEIAWTAGTAADWAFLVILLVVAYDAGGAFAVGLLGAIRVLPAIVAAPLATTLLERFRGNRVLTAINLLRAVGTLATAIVIATDFPIEVTYALAAIVAGAGSLVRPIQSALLPALARSPGELVAANVASSTGEGIGTFVGPLLAGILVTWTGSAAASLLVAGLFAAAAAAVTGLRFERDADAHGGRMAGSYTRFQLTEAVRILRAYPGPATVVGDFVAQTVVRGLLTTLIVIASIEVLEMGDAGVGLLNAAIGLGSLAGAIGALSLVGTTRLTLVFTVALAGWSLPLVLIGAWPIAALALCALFVTGVSNAVLDVSGFTLVQRGVRNEDRVTAFGLMEGLFGIGLLVGSLAAPGLVALLGARGTLLVVGASLPLLAAATARRVARCGKGSALTEELLELLRRNQLFAPLPLTALDRLAESAVPVAYQSGDIVMRQGDVGDHYFLISEGEVVVSDDRGLLRKCGRGEGVGEIALLRRVPRTASVAAASAVRGLQIDSETFLSAVAGPAAAAAAEALVSARLEQSPAAR